MRTFVVPGEPQSKARPRFRSFNVGGRMVTSTYTPKQTVQYEQLIRSAYIAANRSQPVYEAGTKIAVRIWAYFGVPKSTSKRNRTLMLAGQIRPTKKPDVDNLIKAVCDALNGIAYHDDAQVTSVFCAKFYDEEPRLVIQIDEDKEDS